MKWIKTHRKVAIISGVFILLLIGFGVYNIIWYNYVTEYWEKYLEKVERSTEFGEHEVYCITDKEGIDYLVKKPNYLSYVGNLSIAYPQDKSPVTLLIWPYQDKDALKQYYADIDYLYEKAKALRDL